jgi:hypothetical protein
VAASILGPLGSNDSILQEIKYDSLSLQELHEEFTNMMGVGLTVYNFFEERPTCLVKLGFLRWSRMVRIADLERVIGETKSINSV